MSEQAKRSPAGAPITVVVPTFNRAHLVGHAIESALQQTYANFALVVSDNASTDETPRVVARFDDARLRYIRRPQNLELNEHYNLCMAEVSTPYMFVLPDDDLMHPEALETLLPVLEENPHVGIAHGRARLVDDDGNVIHPAHDMTGLPEGAIEQGEAYIREAVNASHRIHATATLYRTKAIQQVPLDPRDRPATEFGVWLRLALEWDLAFVAETVATYRIHARTYTSSNANVTGGGYVQGPDTIENIRDVKLRFLSEHGMRLNRVRTLEREAQRAMARQLVNYAGHATLPERRFTKTVRVLYACTRRSPRMLSQAGTWRLLGASVLGRRLVDRIKERRGEPVALEEVSVR